MTQSTRHSVWACSPYFDSLYVSIASWRVFQRVGKGGLFPGVGTSPEPFVHKLGGSLETLCLVALPKTNFTTSARKPLLVGCRMRGYGCVTHCQRTFVVALAASKA